MLRRCWLFGLFMVGVSFPVAGADEFKLEDGFVRLDNGKDLTGWYASRWNGEPTGDPRGWSVVEGAIELNAAQARSHLFSKRKYRPNVIIRMQFRAAKGADSGVCIHGNQFQVRDYPNSLPDTQKYAKHCKPPGQWNDLEFDITGERAIVKLNGHVIEKSWKIGDAPDRGLGLQREVGDFAYRYIRIKEDEASGW